MKTAAKLAFLASAFIGGSALAFQDSMVDYPSNVAVEQHEPAMTRAEVNADLVNNEARAHVNALQYPSVYANSTAQTHMLTRTEVKQELAHVVGSHFRNGVSTIESGRG